MSTADRAASHPNASKHQFASCKADHAEHRRAAGVESSVYLHGEGKVNVRDFLQTECFPGLELPRVSPEKVKRFQKFLEKVQAVQTSSGWSERPMYTPLVNSFVDISTNAVRTRALPLRFHTCADLRPLDSNGGVRASPDIAIHDNNGKETYWGRSLAFIEVKPTEADDPFYNIHERKELRMGQTKVWNQIQEYAAISFRSTPRCFLLAIGIFGDTARFFRWDRSTVMASEGFNYKRHPEHLVHFLIGLSEYANGGIDATANAPITARAEQELVERQYKIAQQLLVVPEYKPSRKGDTLVKDSRRMLIPSPSQTAGKKRFDTYLTLGRPIFTSKSIFGRGTCVWVATRATPRRGGKESLVIIKDSWRENGRWKEGQIYDKIREAGEHVPGVARLLVDYDITEDEEDEIHRTSAFRLNRSFKSDQKKKKKYKELIHHRVILPSVGIPLSRFTSTRLLLEAVRDAVEGHKTMCARRVIHRDISVNNIMISADVEAEGGAKGFLIDPELAAATGMANLQAELQHLTGTYQFTSIHRFLVAKPGDHAPWNDLESFYWVVLFVVLRHTVAYVDEDGKRTEAGKLIKDLYDSGDHSPTLKKGFLERKAAKFVVEGNRPLTSCLIKLGSLVYSHYRDEEIQALLPHAVNRLTHDNVLTVINEALTSEGWPVADEAIPFTLVERVSIQENKETGLALEGHGESWTMPSLPHAASVSNEGSAKMNDSSPSHAACASNGGSFEVNDPSPQPTSSQKHKSVPVEKKVESGTRLRRSARLNQLKVDGGKQQKRPRAEEHAPAAASKPTSKRSRQQPARDVPLRRSQRIASSTAAPKGREAAKARATAPRPRSTRNA
ncbi:hypothetical protein GLOTRDRAFT_131126 [Gloeophyllum trabeum ATCC 11539]|uniref:Fungal-type protein kinase domain-containing protein n=1 Tax=Gloeophyllum trabeum (strain ATCC 11539 / FP-39264 / Madison 617) TaxID=670483 RepID=S7RM56_GLOTA|nr:uncharacterized protein GLOTRDRAFT_131126 [Gloeophyllum trabeum ATCC 11539]EPQ53794.1 hypothetical protein GLOTRDRAFT_131126 [Gloeophyllum trabeum ATCC 11539]